MNELSNHDHSRFLTRTNRIVGRLGTHSTETAGQGISKAVFREAVVVQMTWPGSPTIYYGDEAGLVGWTDPDCRRTYPWGHEDAELIEMHKALTKLRKDNPVFAEGSIKPVFADTGIICYSRFQDDICSIVSCNNMEETKTISIPVRDIGIPDGHSFSIIFRTDQNGFYRQEEKTDSVKNGELKIELGPQSAVIMFKTGRIKNGTSKQDSFSAHKIRQLSVSRRV
jgi:alpha-glucosidase